MEGQNGETVKYIQCIFSVYVKRFGVGVYSLKPPNYYYLFIYLMIYLSDIERCTIFLDFIMMLVLMS